MERFFVYGTLRDPKTQLEVFGRIAEMHSDKLPNFIKQTVEINNNLYPIAAKSKGNFIEGKVIEATPEELLLIDKYETSAYERVEVHLASEKKAWVYRKP